MRLLIAAVVFFIGVFVITSLIMAALPENAQEWLTPVVILVAVLCSLFLVNKFVNKPGTNFLSWPKPETLEQLAQDGVLSIAVFRATRAFQVEEFKAEGSHYFIELQDGSVLYLNGKYLYEHEPLEFENKIVQAREFPCTEFTIRRRSDDGTVVDFQCGGRVIEPEVVAPSFSEPELQSGTRLNDGDVITDRTYDEVKAERLGGGIE